MRKTLVAEVQSLFTKIYGKGWEDNPACPNTDEMSQFTYQCVDSLAREVTLREDVAHELALIQLVDAYLEEFKSKGPDFPLTTSNPRLAALIVTPPTIADTLQWHIDHPGYRGEEKLRALESELKKHWKELRPQLLK